MPGSKPPLIELRGIRKSFDGKIALDDVSLRVGEGEIHAIVGENGAGKSTAMKILYGQYRPDAGSVQFGGQTCRWRSSADAIAAGFGMVHQHFMLAGCHSAVENVLLTSGARSFGILPLREARARLGRLSRDAGMELRLDVPVEELSVGEQQRVEILKLLYRDSRVLILDEPTAVLAPAEIELLFQTLRSMADRGKTILIITHKLREVLALASRVTVLRAGRVAGERQVASTSVAELASLMVGHEVSLDGERRRKPRGEEAALELEDALPAPALSRLERVSLRVRRGEILGIAGVEGNGQTELIRLLLDPRSGLQSGRLRLFGRECSRLSGAELRARGLAVFPEDRLHEALLLESSLTANFLLGHQREARFRRGAFLNLPAIDSACREALREFDVRPAEPRLSAGSLSGGNQQKLVVARELGARAPERFLIAAQPTRGVDIGAIQAIHQRLLGLRDSGAGVLLISSELEEVLKLSDRVLVFYRGRIAGGFERDSFDERTIGLLMAGGAGGKGATA